MRFLFTILSIFLLSITTVFPQYTWQLKHSGNSLGNPIAVDKHNSNLVYFGSTASVYKSTDRGETFNQYGVNIPTSNYIDAIIPSYYDPNTILVAVHSAGDKIYKTTDNGNTWTISANGLSFSFYGIPMTVDPSNPDTVYTMSNNQFMKSTDFGDSWSTVSFVTEWSTPCDIEVFPDMPNIILAGDNGTGIWRSTDYGVTWTSAFTTSGEIPTITTDKHHPGIAWATKWAGGGGYLKTTNYGMTWTPVNYFNGNYMWGTDTNPVDSNQVLAGCYSCGHIYMTKDNGNTWFPTNIGSNNYAVYIVDSVTIFAAQGNGIYKLSSPTFLPVEFTAFTSNVVNYTVNLAWTTATETNNKGFNVEISSDGYNFQRVGFVPGFGTTTDSKSYSYKVQDKFNGKRYFRLKQIDFDGTYALSKTIEVDVHQPSVFKLSQNYPNPFNPSTTISFSVPSKSLVKINLYNLLGQQVANLLNSEVSDGQHEITYNAVNLPSGTYFYTLEAKGTNGSLYRDTKKMILLK